MNKLLYLRNNRRGTYWKARYIKRRKAYRITHYTPGGEVSTSTKNAWAYLSEEDMKVQLKYNRILKNKPSKAMVQKAGWFGNAPPSWVKN